MYLRSTAGGAGSWRCSCTAPSLWTTTGRRLLAQAIASHSTASPLALAQALVFKDDLTTNGIPLTPLSPAAHAEALARCGISLRVQASWLDSDYGAVAL